MSKPSHIFLIVVSLGSLLLPYKIFFTEDGGKAETVASLFIVRLRSSHNCKMRTRTANAESKAPTPIHVN